MRATEKFRSAEAICNTLIRRLEEQYNYPSREYIATTVHRIRRQIHAGLERVDASESYAEMVRQNRETE